MFFRKYWIPLSVFIVAIVGVGLYYLQTRPPKPPILIVKPVEYEKPPAKTPVVEQPEQVGHVHEDGTFHADTPAPVATPKRTEPLTYHTELLDSHPVEALRLQAEERGHWSARWIPPFPPNDTEAATFARNQYLCVYYQSIGDESNPIYLQAVREESAMRKTITYGSDYSNGNARPYDLMKLSWVTMHEPVPGTLSLPSDYF